MAKQHCQSDRSGPQHGAPIIRRVRITTESGVVVVTIRKKQVSDADVVQVLESALLMVRNGQASIDMTEPL